MTAINILSSLWYQTSKEIMEEDVLNYSPIVMFRGMHPIYVSLDQTAYHRDPNLASAFCSIKTISKAIQKRYTKTYAFNVSLYYFIHINPSAQNHVKVKKKMVYKEKTLQNYSANLNILSLKLKNAQNLSYSLKVL